MVKDFRLLKKKKKSMPYFLTLKAHENLFNGKLFKKKKKKKKKKISNTSLSSIPYLLFLFYFNIFDQY